MLGMSEKFKTFKKTSPSKMTESELLTNLHNLPFVAVSMTHALFTDHIERFLIVPRCVYNDDSKAHGVSYIDISIKDWQALERNPLYRNFNKGKMRMIEPVEVKKRLDYFLNLRQIKPFE